MVTFFVVIFLPISTSMRFKIFCWKISRFQKASKPPENSRYEISSEDVCLKQPLFVTQHGKVLWFTWHFSTLHPKQDWMHYVNDSLFPRAVDKPCQYNDIAGLVSHVYSHQHRQGERSSCWLFRPFLWTLTSQSRVLLHSLCHVIWDVL